MKKIIIPILLMMLMISTAIAFTYSSVDKEGNSAQLTSVHSWWDKIIMTVKQGGTQSIWFYSTATPTPGSKIDIYFQIPNNCQLPTVIDKAKMMIDSPTQIAYDVISFTELKGAEQCGQPPYTWNFVWTVPATAAPGNWKVRALLFDTSGNTVGSDSIPFTVVSSAPTTCPKNFCETEWKLYGTPNNGKIEVKSCYIYGTAPKCSLTPGDSQYRTTCNSGYVCKGTTSATCSGINSCVSASTTPPTVPPSPGGSICSSDADCVGTTFCPVEGTTDVVICSAVQCLYPGTADSTCVRADKKCADMKLISSDMPGRECTADETCQGEIAKTTDVEKCCYGGPCMGSKTCSAQGGTICTYGRSCFVNSITVNFLAASDVATCCKGTCSTPPSVKECCDIGGTKPAWVTRGTCKGTVQTGFDEEKCNADDSSLTTCKEKRDITGFLRSSSQSACAISLTRSEILDLKTTSESIVHQKSIDAACSKDNNCDPRTGYIVSCKSKEYIEGKVGIKVFELPALYSFKEALQVTDVMGFCYAEGLPCTQDAECASGEVCKDGECIPKGTIPSGDICNALSSLNFINVECGGVYILGAGGVILLILMMTMMGGGRGYGALPPVKKYKVYLIAAIIALIIKYLANLSWMYAVIIAVVLAIIFHKYKKSTPLIGGWL
jgi:hypothetical protein